VQGVGFRFYTQRIAEELGLSGWVENLSDGRVEISAEGSEDKLKELLSGINNTFGRYIQDVQLNWEPATGEFHKFNIRH
jgi:acylphosphatase